MKTKKRFILQSRFGSLEGAFIFAEDVIYETSTALMFRERRGNENPIFVFSLPLSLIEDAFSLASVLIYTDETAKVKASFHFFAKFLEI